jgi:hypothetical protein
VLDNLRLPFHCHPIEESAAPAPGVQEQSQHHLSSSWRPSRPFVEFTYKGPRAAFAEQSSGAGSLIDGRMRRACSPFEAWGAWPRSRFATRSANCLKVGQHAAELGREKKTAAFGKALVLYGCHKCILRIW